MAKVKPSPKPDILDCAAVHKFMESAGWTVHHSRTWARCVEVIYAPSRVDHVLDPSTALFARSSAIVDRSATCLLKKDRFRILFH